MMVEGRPARRVSRALSVDWSRVPFGTIFATVGTVVAVYLAGKVLYQLREVVLIMIVGGFIALLVNPLVLALQRRGLRRRAAAVGVVTSMTILLFVALAFLFGTPLVKSVTNFANALPHYVKQAQRGRGWIGHLVQRYHIESWVQKNSPKLIDFAQSLTKPALSLGKGALAIIAALVTMFIFVVLLLLEAPKLRVALLDALSPSSAARWRRVGAEVSRSISGFMLGDLATSFIAGVVVFVTFTVLGVPYAPLWGLWVALVDFLPEVGGALAIIPSLLFAFTQSLTAGVVSSVVFVVYWQLENRLLNPIVMSRTVRINPLLIFVVMISAAGIGAWIGGVFGGFAAALMAIPAAAGGQALVREMWWNPLETVEPVAPTEANPPGAQGDPRFN
jgi:predicted PurR-regulated permease PerM